MDRLRAGFVSNGCAVSTHRVEAWSRGRNSEIVVMGNIGEVGTDNTAVLCRKLAADRPKLTRMNELLFQWWRVCQELETG